MQEESKRTPWKEKKASQHILKKSSADVLDSLQTSMKSFFSRIQIFLNFIISFRSLFHRLFFFISFFFCLFFLFYFILTDSFSPSLNQTICIFSLGDWWHWKVNHLSAQLQPQKIAVAKRGNTYTKPTENKRGNTVCTWRLFYILDSCFFCFLNKKPSAGCHGIRKKCDKRFVKVAEEGGLEEGHFWLKTSRVQKPQELM